MAGCEPFPPSQPQPPSGLPSRPEPADAPEPAGQRFLARSAAATSALPKRVTLVLTEQCNFRCTYCYLVHKNPEHRMPFAVAREAIDYLLGHPELFPEPRVSWDFIGGEPLLEVELIEQVVGYVRRRAYELGHPWFEGSEFSVSSNGALYGTPAVQRLVRRYRRSMGVSITVDGPEHVHDACRKTVDGRGTYAAVAANVPLWLAQYPQAATKVTVGHENLPFLTESILHLFGLGLREIHANVVFEDVWQQGDDALLEQQLDALAEELLERDLWRTHRCSFFQRGIGVPLDPQRDHTNWCGAGKMLAVGPDGTFYPCNRFLAFSLSRRPPRTLGSVAAGLDLNRVRPFLALTRAAQSPPECLACEVARGCAWCQGLNYDDAATPTIYQRATHICRMHHARVRANRRFWEQVDAREGGRGPA